MKSQLKILITGDFCPTGRTEKLLIKESYSELFNGFEEIIADIDYSVVNFECPFTTSSQAISKSGPNLKTENPNSFKALKYAGFDLLTLANNHIQDFGGQGVKDTIKEAKKNNLEIIGAGENYKKARRPVIKKIKGINIGFINIAENEFCSATENVAGAYTLDLIDNIKLINETKPKVDKLILIYHGGREHYQLPTPQLRKRLRFFIETGVDAIVAHHTHCFSGYEYYHNKPIVYSLGNFIFDFKKKYQKGLWTQGMSVILKLKKSEFKIELIPHLQGRKKDFSLKILKNEEKHRFLKRVEELNNIIVNDQLFMRKWDKYIQSQNKYYLPNLYIKNYYLRAIFMKGLLPISLLKSKHRILLLNLFRCETHSEIVKAILKNHER